MPRGVGECFPAPRSGEDVPGTATAAQKVERDHRELQSGSTLEEEHLEVVGCSGETPRRPHRSVVHPLVDLAAMAHLEEGHPGPTEVDQLGLSLLHHLEGENGRAGVEIGHPPSHQERIRRKAEGGRRKGSSDAGKAAPVVPDVDQYS